MGLTYGELSELGRLRKCDRLGPWGVYIKLLPTWHEKKGLEARVVAEKVKRFFTRVSSSLVPAAQADIL